MDGPSRHRIGGEQDRQLGETITDGDLRRAMLARISLENSWMRSSIRRWVAYAQPLQLRWGNRRGYLQLLKGHGFFICPSR